VAGATLGGGRNFKPGRPKSLGHRSAVHWLQRGAVSEWTHPEGRAPEHQVRSSRCRLTGYASYSEAGQRGHTRPPTRSGRTAVKRTWPAGDATRRGDVPAQERAHVGIPGPDVGGADADTSTSTALAPCGVRASRFVSVGTNPNGSPSATDVAASIAASRRHEGADAVHGARLRPRGPNRCSGAPLRARCRGLAARRCRRAAILKLSRLGRVNSASVQRTDVERKPSPRRWRMRLGGTSP
jgi:hypothetical protein